MTVNQNIELDEYADTLERTLPCPPPEHRFETLAKQSNRDHSHAH